MEVLIKILVEGFKLIRNHKLFKKNFHSSLYMIKIKPSSKESHIGVLSDTHGDIKLVRKAVDFLKKHPVDLLVLPGDIGFFTIKSYQLIINACRRLKIPLIPFPGSHENSFTWKKSLAPYKKDKNIIDGFKNRLIRFGDYNLVMVPGSQVVSSGTKSYNGGNIWLTSDKITPARLRQANKKITRS